MGAPAISVIIPVYKAEQTLARAVDSVLTQTFTDYEIVLVDDGSPDRSGEIADDYARHYSCVKVTHQANGGASEARRTGHRMATGTYTMHLDSDDTLPPDALEFLHHVAVTQDLDVVHGGFTHITPETTIVRTRGYDTIMTGKELLSRLLDLDFHIYAGVCFSRREFWDDEAMFVPREVRIPGEDILFNHVLAMRARRVGVYDHPVYNYHYNAASLTNSGALFGTDPLKRLFVEMRRLLREGNVLPEAVTEPKVRLQEIHFLCFYARPLVSDDPWVQRVASYPVTDGSRRVRIMQFLIRHAWLRQPAIGLNRLIKKFSGRNSY